MRRTATWFALVVAASAVGASAQLNPTVKVLSKAQAPVPAECAEGLAPAPPRAVAEAPQVESKPAPAPPSLDLKTRLRAVQTAAEQNDRDAFKSALADARNAIASYPRGGERDAANDVVGVYSDLERLWDYQFNTAAGAFFDSGTDLVNMMRRYPDYQKFISDKTLTIGGQTIYPSTETRQFLTAEASRRLARLGVRIPTRIVEQPRPPVQPRVAQPVAPQPSHKAPKKVAAKPAHRKPATKIAEARKPAPRPRSAKPTPAPTPRHVPAPPTKIAEARKPSPQPRAAQPTPVPAPAPTPRPVPAPPTKIAEARKPSPQPRPAQPTPVPAPAPTPQLPAPAPAPAPTPVPQPVAPAPAPTTATETTATTATTVTEPAPTATTSAPAQTQQQQGSGRMNLLLAIILIIVGIGVLIVLFRASD